ncbi:MAG: replication-associated recombination protein A [Corynebacterium casei]|uniref:Replication-associated recombination protein A n=3 Tax=Corynebacterium casei TaxID=160386 RepID=G7I171_9CORY|nr:replication-associated recombination protein A [Corynebacterium casei]AHI19947.1 recombination factor protein RarA [Corynebacterium casei LMG S-19264]MDN5706426.1 replication-associated recombination protein A [Corynebacterium casei]MDN5728232.1 replication-associated recombination protein A [Corynebacterium casei]MDN5740005.1 replication-associated recombination protein A [Corynebacterium casei]MDN5783779.1 replication-associated recombination protein A [Corynebacterium casei]
MSQDSLFPTTPSASTDSDSATGIAGRGNSMFATHSGSPLAARMRPQTLDEVLGQDHLLAPGKPLRRLVEGSGEASVILYGPPGTGKTTIASLIASAMGQNFVGLSALDSGVKQVREVITHARQEAIRGVRTVLFIDEVHRFSKTQQDALLAAVENRTVLLVAATTENPSFSVVAPLLSRSLLLQLNSLEPEHIGQLIDRAIASERGLQGRITIADDAREQLTMLAGGDARRVLTYLEAAAETTEANAVEAKSAEASVDDSAADDSGADESSADEAVAGKPVLTSEILNASVNRAVVRYDRDGDQHYDVVSAFIKSIRGSDVDAALHYLARMIEAGEDPRFIARRLIVHASEDIGMADPTALPTAVAAAQAAQLIGLPEARIPLAQAVIHLATAPKSNSVMQAIAAAQEDIGRGKIGHVPPHLRDGHYEGAKRLGSAVGYQFPHDDPRGVVAQQYLPDELADAQYYHPTDHGAEKRINEYLPRLRGIVRQEPKSGKRK